MVALSDNFKLHEALRSATATKRGINNAPNAQQLVYIALAASLICEPLRELLGGKPLRASSWFRCLVLNRAVGGSSTSAHMDGRAVDIPPQNGFSAKQIFDAVRASAIAFDKIIWERDKRGREWVHIQIARIGQAPRRRVLKGFYSEEKGRISYENYQ